MLNKLSAIYYKFKSVNKFCNIYFWLSNQERNNWISTLESSANNFESMIIPFTDIINIIKRLIRQMIHYSVIKESCINLNLFLLRFDHIDIYDYMLKEKRLSFMELYLI